MSAERRLHDVPLDDAHWDWSGPPRARTEHLGRPCIALETPIAPVPDLILGAVRARLEDA